MSQEDLKAYLDGEISPEARAAVEAALASDTETARELGRELGRLRAIALGLAQEAPFPVTGRAETIARLSGQDRRPRIGVSGWTWGLGLAGVLGLIVLSIPKPLVTRTGMMVARYSPPPPLAQPLPSRSQVSVSMASGMADAMKVSQAKGASKPVESRAPRVVGGSSLEIRVRRVAEARATIQARVRRVGGSVTSVRTFAGGGVLLSVAVRASEVSELSRAILGIESDSSIRARPTVDRVAPPGVRADDPKSDPGRRVRFEVTLRPL